MGRSRTETSQVYTRRARHKSRPHNCCNACTQFPLQARTRSTQAVTSSFFADIGIICIRLQRTKVNQRSLQSHCTHSEGRRTGKHKQLAAKACPRDRKGRSQELLPPVGLAGNRQHRLHRSTSDHSGAHLVSKAAVQHMQL